jgi:membrane dipeptidase
MNEIGSRVLQLLNRGIVWDNHTCMPIRPLDDSFFHKLERHRTSGWHVVSINVGFGTDSVENHFRMLASLRRWIVQNADHYLLVQQFDDLEAARLSKRLAIVFDIEGMGAVADQPSLVDLYYTLGVRWMSVAYNTNNLAGGGCHDHDIGLTAFGADVIRAMEACGMLVCCSHTGEKTAHQVMAVAQKPVLLSHSNAAAVYSHPRNVSDALMRACAATGGVIGFNGLSVFLGDGNQLQQLVRHIQHGIDTVGSRHIGLSLDYVFDQQELNDWLSSPSNTWPAGFGYQPGITMLDPDILPRLVDSLIAVGLSDDEIQAVLGENWLRVAREVWR